MNVGRFAYVWVAVVLSVFLAACADDPTDLDRPPVVTDFFPRSQDTVVTVGDTLVFRIDAWDPDRASLKQTFYLDDLVVSRLPRWNYVVEHAGSVIIKCIVTDGSYSKQIQWDVTQTDPINYPPEIYTFTPKEPNPVLIIGDELEFGIQATDPEGDSLVYYFNVDGLPVATDSDFTFFGVSEGDFEIEGVVTDGENFATHMWNLNVTPVPDTIPPAEVQFVLVETGDQPGEVNIAWTAVGADGMEGVASAYMVRTLPSPMFDEASWERGSRRPGVPEPALPGETMSMVIDELVPARYTYVAVRAVDNFGNLSPIGETPGVNTRGMRISGEVINSITGLPVPDAHVGLSIFHTMTDENGGFEFVELPPLLDPVVVSDDNQPGIIGDYYDYHLAYEVVHEDFIRVALIPNYQLESNYYDDFLTFFLAMTELQGIPYPRHQRRWELPIDVYANPFENGGLDYKATIEQALIGLNSYLDLGTDAFRVLDDEPEVGVVCRYRTDLAYDNFSYDLFTWDYFPLKGTVTFRTVYTGPTQSAFERVMRHEFGHVLGLNHSEDLSHLMIGGVSPSADNFTTDEIVVIKTRYNIPRGLPLSTYVRD